MVLWLALLPHSEKGKFSSLHHLISIDISIGLMERGLYTVFMYWIREVVQSLKVYRIYVKTLSYFEQTAKCRKVVVFMRWVGGKWEEV